MKFVCPCCGEEKENWPALAFSSPVHYHMLSEEDKEKIGRLSSDFCIIKHHDQTDRFIRGVLIQKVNGACQDLEYGVWVSLSEKNFIEYYDNFKEEMEEKTYFGWLCTQLPEYEDLSRIKTHVITQKGNARPRIEINRSNNPEHPFVKDYFEGISEEEALRRINWLLNK